jgi:lactoylglutathione lyase
VGENEEVTAAWSWGVEDTAPRMLHVMLRIRDIDASLRFYRDGLGMHLLDRHDVPQGRFSILFLSFAGYRDGPAAIELTYNWDQEEAYSHGSGYGHIAIGVPDIEAAFARLIDHGGAAKTAPKQMIPGTPMLAFVTDPDGYAVELIQTRR